MLFKFLKNLINLIDKIDHKKSVKFKLILQQLSVNVFKVKIKKKNIEFYVKNYHCYKRYSTILTKEKGTIEWIDGFKKKDLLWDIGANIGIYTLYASIISKVNVVAFEPIINSAQVLRKNIELNNLSRNVKLLNIAIGKKNSNTKIFYESNHAGSARHSLIKDARTKRFENILCLSPSFILKQKIVNYPNHIKIDTDGNELEILKSMGEILKYKKLKSLCIENEFGKGESSRKKKIVKILKKNNFYLKKIDFLNIGYNMFFYRK
mgnify:CR=1 FL=1